MSNLTKLLRVCRPNLFGKANVINRSYASCTLSNPLHYRRLPTFLTSANSLTSQLRLICTDPSPDMSASSTPSSTPSTPVTEGLYDIRPIKADDTNKVIQFLRKFFFRDEPLNIEQNLLETDEDTCPELEGYSIKSMHEGISLMAVAPAGDIVGICLNGVMDRQNPDEEEFECANEKFARILKLLDTVDKEADVFGQFPDVNKIISVKILSVDGSWRGKGIAKALMDRTRELAREMGYTLMRVDCTSHYSARAVARLGFECVYTLKYADYKENGKPVFVPEPPHSEVKVYTQRVA